MPKIALKHVTKKFGEKIAVNDLSLEIDNNEFMVIVGPSGCGKTTTLRMIAGLETVSSGEICFDERRVSETRPRDRNVAMVFQDYAVFPHLTVYENIAYGLRSRHVANMIVRERVPEAARTFRIEHLLTRKPRQLSGGERQRVALARAMVRDSAVCLYDEPLSNLDAQLRHQAREDILMLHQRQRRTSVYVTHDQSEAMALGDRIAVMRAGRFEQVGTGTELYEKPANKFVAFFIGTPSINLFEATLQQIGDAVYAVNPAFSLRLDDQVQAPMLAFAGKPVWLGIRPEALHVPRNAPFAVSEDNTLHGLVNVIEPSASGCTVYLSTLDSSAQDFAATFKIRVPASYLGKEIPLAIEAGRVHIFDRQSEQTLY